LAAAAAAAIHDRDVRWSLILVAACAHRAPAKTEPRVARQEPVFEVSVDVLPPAVPTCPPVASTTLPYEDTFVEDTGTPQGGFRGVTFESAEVPAIGATVVATPLRGAGEQVVLTDERGVFEIRGLEPGKWLVTYYFYDAFFTHELVIHAGTWTVERVSGLAERPAACR